MMKHMMNMMVKKIKRKTNRRGKKNKNYRKNKNT